MKTKQAITTAEAAYEAGLERHINELCNIEHEDPDPFEFVLTEKVYHLHYAGEGRLPIYTKEKRPDTIYFIQSIKKGIHKGCFILTTSGIATSQVIRKELERLEMPFE